MPATQLRIEFCGEEYSAEPGETLTFGRSGDVVIDDNRFLHRVLGEFKWANHLWWLSNVGSSIAITVTDDSSPSLARFAPGTSMPITFEAATLRFEAGGTAYELTVDIVGGSGSLGAGDEDDELDGGDVQALAEMTTTTTNLPLTEDQFALLVTLAAPLLNNAGSLPTNRQLANSLGWTVTKYNRKLDGLCHKFAKAGVAGLHGSADRLAKDRRTRLAEHVVHAGIVTAQDLG